MKVNKRHRCGVFSFLEAVPYMTGLDEIPKYVDDHNTVIVLVN